MDLFLAAAAILIFVITLVLLLKWIWPSIPASESEESQTFTSLPQKSEAMLLECIEGPIKGTVFSLESHEIVLGRSSQCDICIKADLASRKHALIVYEDGQYILYDQNSTNGTWVNEERIAQHVIQPGDRIQIGPGVFVARLSDQTVEPQALSYDKPAREKLDQQIRHLPGYEILKSWTGGMSMVHQARELKTGQMVALKVLRSQNPYIHDKFIKEIEVGKKLRHPHIVSVYDGGQEGEDWYMVMEFVEGGTLKEVMQPNQPLALDFTVQVVGQICEALAYAHQCGVFHRDIKPANILLTADRTAKLGDFGIARLAQAVTRTAHGLIVGTPKYMSYEQVGGGDIDGRSDIYSLGIVLYEALTGRLPFFHSDPMELIDLHLKREPIPPRQINPNIPPGVEAATLRALHKNKSQRFQDARDLARAIGYVSTTEVKASLAGGEDQNLQLVIPDRPSIRLEKQHLILGRSLVNPGDKQISRRHANVAYRGDCWWLEDNDSANGVYLNGRRIFEPVMLQEGDKIRLGRTELRVERI